MGIKKKRVKGDMKGMVITSSKLRSDISTNDITEELIEFYIKNGLGYIFEEYCIKCDKVGCICGVKSKKKTTKKKTDDKNNKK